MVVGFKLFANNLFDVEGLLVNVGLIYDRAAPKATAFLFTEDTFVDRLARYEVPAGVPVHLCSKKEFLPLRVDKIVSSFQPDYTVYVFDTPTPPPMNGRRLVVNLNESTEQWILD